MHSAESLYVVWYFSYDSRVCELPANMKHMIDIRLLKDLLVCGFFGLAGAAAGFILSFILAILISHAAPNSYSGYVILLFSSSLILIGAAIGLARGIALWKARNSHRV